MHRAAALPVPWSLRPVPTLAHPPTRGRERRGQANSPLLNIARAAGRLREPVRVLMGAGAGVHGGSGPRGWLREARGAPGPGWARCRGRRRVLETGARTVAARGALLATGWQACRAQALGRASRVCASRLDGLACLCVPDRCPERHPARCCSVFCYGPGSHAGTACRSRVSARASSRNKGAQVQGLFCWE